MRKFLLGAAMALAVLLPGKPVVAQIEGTWCLKYPHSPGGVGERCSFRSFEACRNERTLWGSTSFCVQNPGYLPYWQGRFGEEPRRKVSRKKKSRQY